MKYLLLIFCVSLFACKNKHLDNGTSSQPTVFRDSTLLKKEAANPYVPVDVSAMDMLYFPTDFPVKKMNGQVSGLPKARVIYSRPHRGGRSLFGSLVQWGQPWRLGANEATEIEFFQPAIIQGKKIEKGRYILYAVPFENHWTIAFNKDLFSWGLKLNTADDVVRFDVPSNSAKKMVEYFTMTFVETPIGADLLMAWETTEVRLPIQF